MFKLYGTEQNMKRNDLLMSILGVQGLGWAGDGFNGAERGSTRGWLRSKANSIEGRQFGDSAQHHRQTGPRAARLGPTSREPDDG